MNTTPSQPPQKAKKDAWLDDHDWVDTPQNPDLELRDPFGGDPFGGDPFSTHSSSTDDPFGISTLDDPFSSPPQPNSADASRSPKAKADHQKAELVRKAEEARRAEELQRAQEQRRRAEEARRIEEQRRRAEEARRVEEQRRRAEEARRVEEQRRRAEEARKAEEAYKLEEYHRRAEELRQAEEARRAQENQILAAAYSNRPIPLSRPAASLPHPSSDPQSRPSAPPQAIQSPSGVSPETLQRILKPMHQLMRSQADEIKKLKHALKETQSQVQAPPPPSSSQPDSLLSEQLETLRSELLEVRAQLVEQHHLIEQTQLQAEQARLFTSLRSSGGRSGWGLGSLFSSLGESLARLKPKRAPTLADLRAKTSGGPLPPPPVPVYDPFEESTSIEGLTTQKSDTQEEKPIQDPWEIKEELLHRPVVTNIPQPISDEETPTGLSNEEAKVSSTSTDENVSHSAESEALITSGKPFQSVMGSSPFPEHQVGGLTMSRFSQQGLDPQMTAIILQQTQVIKQLDFQVKQLTSRLNEQASSTKNQSEIIEQLIASSHRANDKVQNRVKKLERSRDISQQNSSGLKIHHKRISQLEMLIEGFEAKLAMFQEKLSAKDPTKQATDIRVSLDPDTGDFQSIQEAIDAAPVGAYIGVMPGIYQDPIEITKPVKIIGLGRPQDILIQVKEETALVLNRMGGGYEEAMSSQQEQEVRKRLQQYTGIEAPTMGSQVLKWVKRKLGQPVVADEGVFDDKTGTDEVSLASLTISSITTEVGGPPSERPAIIVRSGHLRLDNCAIRCENGHGIVLEGEGVELTLRASKIIQVRGSGIYLRTRAQATLAGSSIIKSKEVGIDAQGNTSLRLMDCDISNNQRTGIQVGFKSQLIIYNTVISGNHFEGIWMNNKSTGVIKGCDMRGNARGPYDISTDCHVEMSGNKP